MPVEVDGEAVESLRESWLVEDRWWTDEPLRRRYWELVGERGRNVVVFHDLTERGPARRWFVQSMRTCDGAYRHLRRAALPLGVLVPGRRVAAAGAGAARRRARLRRRSR